ncbi:hypothetical protein RRG08_022402 [Elysia crispata]|uniref:Uncharacterized protein n=1 Tax=Elysia crispata TaxID=231223 RepID=A0AAE1D8T7_9GAST|nr:hypothetical protein RRG08_022402 [Elysia crispata]
MFEILAEASAMALALVLKAHLGNDVWSPGRTCLEYPSKLPAAPGTAMIDKCGVSFVCTVPCQMGGKVDIPSHIGSQVTKDELYLATNISLILAEPNPTQYCCVLSLVAISVWRGASHPVPTTPPDSPSITITALPSL